MAAKKKQSVKNKWVERLQNPMKMRIAVTASMLAIGFLIVYAPLTGRIDSATRRVNEQAKIKTLADEVQFLRAQVQMFNGRLPKNTDANEWVQFVLAGLRQFPLKLNNLDSGEPRRLGPYKAVVMNMDLEGEFAALDSYLQWLESNQRLFRVDSARIAPGRDRRDGNQKLVMQLTLLGVKG